MIPKRRLWVSDWGEIDLPDDFPMHIFRKDGWWDMRYTQLRWKWELWIEAEEEKLKSGQ